MWKMIIMQVRDIERLMKGNRKKGYQWGRGSCKICTVILMALPHAVDRSLFTTTSMIMMMISSYNRLV